MPHPQFDRYDIEALLNEEQMPQITPAEIDYMMYVALDFVLNQWALDPRKREDYFHGGMYREVNAADVQRVLAWEMN